MRLVSVGFSLLLLAALPAAADGVPLRPLGLDVTPDGSCAQPAAKVAVSSSGGIGSQATCYAEAQCEMGTVSCNGQSTCTAVDQDCSAGRRGYVTCDGNTTYCGSAERWLQTSSCCYGLYLWKHQDCSASTGWYWQDTGLTDCLLACDGSGGI